MARRRRFTAEFNARVALEALRGDRTIQQIAAEREVHPNLVSAWKKRVSDRVSELFASGSGAREAEVRTLHAKIGELVVARDFLLRGLKR